MELKQRWHISYKADVEDYPSDITWCVDLLGTLPEVVTQLYKIDKVTEVVAIHEIKRK